MSAHCGNVATEESPKVGLCPTLIEWLQKVLSNAHYHRYSTAHSWLSNSLDQYVGPMHNHDDIYLQSGFEPSTSEFRHTTATNIIYWTGVGLLLAYRRIPWANIKPTPYQYTVFSWASPAHFPSKHTMLLCFDGPHCLRWRCDGLAGIWGGGGAGLVRLPPCITWKPLVKECNSLPTCATAPDTSGTCPRRLHFNAEIGLELTGCLHSSYMRVTTTSISQRSI